MIFTSCSNKGNSSWGDSPDITIYDENMVEKKLSSFIGKGIVLNFWASWCPPCINEMPDFQDAYWQYKDDVQFIMVNVTGWEESANDGVSFIAMQGYTFPVYYDLNNEAPSAYGFDSIPRTYFIDKSGNIVKAHTGSIGSFTLEAYINQII